MRGPVGKPWAAVEPPLAVYPLRSAAIGSAAYSRSFRAGRMGSGAFYMRNKAAVLGNIAVAVRN